MKKYRRYMNGVKAPDTLHQRLRELKAPEKKPAPWAGYGAMAAALVLALGLGGYGAHYYYTVVDPRGDAFLEGTQDFDPAAHPDIAWVDPGDVTEPGEKTLGGYDVREERGGVSVVCRYILPYIEYGEAGPRAELDWDIPEGASRRDLTRDEIIALMGGGNAVDSHLAWGKYELTGWGAWYEDGSFWGAYIDGVLPYVGGPASQFEFAVTAGQLPPTCCGYRDSVTQEIRGLTVTADKSDWEEHVFTFPSYVHQRRVSFMEEGYGYRFEMSSGDSELAEEMVSRLVRRIADVGLELSVLDPAAPVETFICSTCGETYSVHTEHFHPWRPVNGGGDVTAADDGGAANTKHSHMPDGADIPDSTGGRFPEADERVSASAAFVCGICGQTLPAQDRDPESCYTCPICGMAFPNEHAGHDPYICGLPPYDPGGAADPDYNAPPPAVSAEICGLPLAPGGDVAAEIIYCD